MRELLLKMAGGEQSPPRAKAGEIFSAWVGSCLAIACIALLLLMAAVVRSVDVPSRASMPMAVAAAAGGAFLSGLTAAHLAGRRGLLFGALCGAMLFLLILIAGFVRYSGVSGGFTAVKLLVLTAAGAIGGVLGVGRKKRR